jgi:hypothetical protein
MKCCDCESGSCGLYYKPMTIVNDDSTVVNKLEASLTDDARVIIYDCHMFIVQATGAVFTFFPFLHNFQMHQIS